MGRGEMSSALYNINNGTGSTVLIEDSNGNQVFVGPGITAVALNSAGLETAARTFGSSNVSAAGGVGSTAGASTVSPSGSVTSLVLKASPTLGGMLYAHAENQSAVAGYLIVYNGTTAPATGPLPAANVLAFQFLPASGFADMHFENAPLAGSAGITLLVSSAPTPFTYTTGVVTAAMYGRAL